MEKGSFFDKNRLIMNKTKMVVGIDISKDEFHACIKVLTESGIVKIKGTRTFANDYQGFELFLRWVLDRQKGVGSLSFVMEATGVYFEDLAYFLHSKDKLVSVVLANKVKNYAKSLNVKTKTDKVDSKIIAGLGIERSLEQWKPMSPQYKKLRDYSRELLSMKKELTRAKNQLHALNSSHSKPKGLLEIKEKQIMFYQDSIAQIQSLLHKAVDQDLELKEKLEKIQTIKGVGFETSVHIISETNGFELFKNIRQVVSYAGLDVEHRESGTFKGRTKISKKGNSRIRQALYMPAMSAARTNKPIKALYERVCEKNPNIKRKGVVASMRKLLILIFVLWKKNTTFEMNYQWAPIEIGE